MSLVLTWDLNFERIVDATRRIDMNNAALINVGAAGTDFDTSGGLTISDDALLRVGTDGDGVFLNRSTILATNTALTNVMIGTPVTPAVAANSLILSNVTASGDILVAANLGGNSLAWLWIDSSASLMTLYRDGVSAIELGAATVVNEGGADRDFRVESDTNTSALVVDAGLFSGVGALGVGRTAVAGRSVLIGSPALTAAANDDHYIVELNNLGAVTIPAGTANIVATLVVNEPNITATGTVTNATSLYIVEAATEATNNYALWSGSGRWRVVPTYTVASAAGAAWNGINVPANTLTITGSTNITLATGVNMVALAQPTLSAASALTVTSAATLYIANAPTGGGAGPATITNAYALWVDAGVSAFGGNVVPDAADGAALGTGVLMWSDLFLASGSVINFNNGDVTLTHGANLLTVAGGDFIVANADGMVVGNAAQITVTRTDAGTGSVPEFQVLGTGLHDNSVLIGGWGTSISQAAHLVMLRSQNTTIGSFTIVVDGDVLGAIAFAGDDGVDYQSLAAWIQGQVDGTPGAGDMPGRLVFATSADGAENPTERLRITSTGAVLATAAAGGIGYRTGAGGAVTQLTDKSTGVTLNTVTGQITMNNASLGATTSVSFTVTNSAVATTDVVIVNIDASATANSYHVGVDAVGAGSFVIHVRNVTAGALSEALVLNFAVIKGVAA